jgi:guanylate kinase
MPTLDRTGQLFVISAPSGVGKTTLVRLLLQELPELAFSVSCTTRPPRYGEIDGRDYHFMTREAFRIGIEAGHFLEWAQVHGEYYGTDRRPLDQWLRAGQDVLLDIDVQGARQVRCCYPRACTIFILPPALDVLEQRLRERGTESPEQLVLRLSAAGREMQESPWYDFIVVNDVLEAAAADLVAIIRAARCRRFARGDRLRAILDFRPPPS